MNSNDAGAWVAVSKVPREHLGQSFLLMQLCRELRSQQSDQGKREIIHQFIGEAHKHVNTLAINARQNKGSVDGKHSQEEWDRIWRLAQGLGPSMFPLDTFERVKKAEKEDNVVNKKLINISGRIERFKARLSVKSVSILVTGPELGNVTYKPLKVGKRTPPRGLSAAIMFSKLDIVGNSFDLYRCNGQVPARKPASWNDDEETPERLFLIPDKGYFWFTLPLPQVWVEFSPFRNIVSFNQHATVLFKDYLGELRKYPEERVIDDQPVYCWRANKNNPTEVEYWRDLVKLLAANVNAKWTIKDSNPPAPSAPSAIPGNSTLSFVFQTNEDNYSIPSKPDHQQANWSVGSETSLGTNPSMYEPRFSEIGQGHPKGIHASKMGFGPLQTSTVKPKATFHHMGSSSRPANPNKTSNHISILTDHYSDSPISRSPSIVNIGLTENTMDLDPHRNNIVSSDVTRAGKKEDGDHAREVGRPSTDIPEDHKVHASFAAAEQTDVGPSKGTFVHSREPSTNRIGRNIPESPELINLSSRTRENVHQPLPDLRTTSSSDQPEPQETPARTHQQPTVPVTDNHHPEVPAVDITLSPPLKQVAHANVPYPPSDPNSITTLVSPTHPSSITAHIEDDSQLAMSTSSDRNRHRDDIRLNHSKTPSVATLSTEINHKRTYSEYPTASGSGDLYSPSLTRPISIQGSIMPSTSVDRRLILSPSHGPSSGIAAAMLRASLVSSAVVAEGDPTLPPLLPPESKKKGMFQWFKDKVTGR